MLAKKSNLKAVKPDRVRVRIVCEGFPPHRFEGCDGRRDIRVDLQTKSGFETGTFSGASTVSFDTEVVVKSVPDGGWDFSGDSVHGKRGERFFYLSWSGEKNGRREMFRRTKIHLRDLKPGQTKQALKGGILVARFHAVARDGGPACASVPLLDDGWIFRND